MSCNSQLPPDGRDTAQQRGANLWFAASWMHLRRENCPHFSRGLTRSSILIYFMSGRVSVSPSPFFILANCLWCVSARRTLEWVVTEVQPEFWEVLCTALVRSGVNGFYPHNNWPFTTVPQNNQMQLQHTWHLITPIYRIIGSFSYEEFFFKQWRHGVRRRPIFVEIYQWWKGS